MKIQISLSVEEDQDHGKALDDTGYWGRQAAGCLFLAKATSRLLIPQRSSKVLEPFTWGTWGGAMDEGETPIQCVRREIVEETKYRGEVELVPLSVFTHSSGFKYHNFLALVETEFRPRLNWESRNAKWVEFGRWPSPLHPGLKAALEIKSNLDTIKSHLSS